MKYSAVLYWLIGIAIAATAIAVSFHFDDSVREFMMQHQNPAMRNFMRYVSLLGDWPLHAAVGLVLLGLAWRRGSEEWTRIFLAMLLAMMLAGVAGTVIKRTVPRARPSVHAETRWGGPHFSSKYHSFPSGHVGASTAFFGVLLIARRRIGLACLPIPILIGVLTDVYRRALSIRRRLRSGSGNFMRACRSVTSCSCQSAIANRKLKIRWRRG